MRGSSRQQQDRGYNESRSGGRGGSNGRGNKGNSRRRGGDSRDDYDRPPSKEKSYGVVLSLKESFGFILPYEGEEHLYFNERDAPYDIAEKDEVEFIVRSGQRGPAAVSVRVLDMSKVKKVESARQKGIVAWEADPYKSTPGSITLSAPDEGTESDPLLRGFTNASFLHVDVDKASRRVMKGDEVEFDLYVLPNSSYARARNLTVSCTKRDRMIGEQIRMFEEAGVSKEQGVIDSIKGREFGFIKACDRAEHLFFRLDDLVDSETLCNEGDEVEFYVISEHSRGKMSDRAVHVTYLPHGTVSFEDTLAEGVLGSVVALPRSSSRGEEPGSIRLHAPVRRATSSTSSSNEEKGGEGSGVVECVELWARCLSDGMSGLLRVGDDLRLDVTNYRPEKLIFARNVTIERFFSIGRCYGTVCDVKESRGFGFIRSSMGDVDTYFRIGEVVGADGLALKESRVMTGLHVSYDVVVEEVKGGGESKLRAVRVREELSAYDRKVVLQEGVQGIVQREPKKDAAGIIELLPEGSADTAVASSSSLSVSILASEDSDILLSHAEMMSAIEKFASLPELKEVVIEHLIPNQRFACHSLVRTRFPGIGHQTLSSASAVGKGQSVRLWKIEDPEEYAQWAASNHESGEGEAHKEVDRKGTGGTVPDKIRFQRGDVVDTYSEGAGLGGVRVGAPVTFALCVDRLTAARVAGKVSVHDDVAAGGEWPRVGVIEFTRGADSSSSGGAIVGGYIRCIPSDEKLPWLSVSAPVQLRANGESEETDASVLQCGVEVFFEIRNRGGVRYASRVSVLPADDAEAARRALALPAPVHRETALEGVCVGVVVEMDCEASASDESKTSSDAPAAAADSPVKTKGIFPLVFAQCPQLAEKAPNISSSILKVLAKKTGGGSKASAGGAECGTDDSILWQKKIPLPVEAESEDGEKIESAAKSKLSVAEGESSKEIPSKESPSKASSVTLSREGVQVFYPPLSLTAIPMEGDDAVIQALPVGGLVEFSCVVNWGEQRTPLRATAVRALEIQTNIPPPAPASAETSSATDKAASSRTTKLSALMAQGFGEDSYTPAASGLVKGVIIRLKISNVAGLELTEIALGDLFRTTSSGPAENVKYFYCYSRDLKAPAGARVSVGDEVEFVPVIIPSALSGCSSGVEAGDDSQELCVAVCPSVIKGAAKAAAVPKKRVPVNASLKQTSVATSVFKNIVTMAAGPADNGSTGFAPGWRTADGCTMCDVSGLPWGPTLLPHLMEAGSG